MADIHRLNPKHSDGNSPSRCSNFKRYEAGIWPLARQTDTAEPETPSNSAAFMVPPKASIMSSTVRCMRHYSLRFLKKSTVQEIKIGDSDGVNDDVSMAVRDEIIARLRQLPEVLGKSDGGIAEILGISASLWSNYKAENTDVTIRPMVALTLWNAFGVPMEWVYDGQTALVPDLILRTKLVAANRRAEAWLVGRNRRPKNNKARIAIIIAAGAALSWGWPNTGHAWKRADGLAVDRQLAWVAHLACAGEGLKISVLAGAAATPELGDSIYIGCMADRGYITDINHDPHEP